MTTAYGSIVTGDDVFVHALAFLKAWMPSYLSEVASQAGLDRDELPAIRSWARSARGLDLEAENQLPACVIICPGITGSIERHGDGMVSAEFALGVGFIVSALDQDTTNRLVSLYTAAGRTAFLQHPSMSSTGLTEDRFASNIRWIDETLDELPFSDSRTLAGGVVNLGVRVDSVLNSRAGLQVPPLDETVTPTDPPVVVSTGVTSVLTPHTQGQEINI